MDTDRVLTVLHSPRVGSFNAMFEHADGMKSALSEYFGTNKFTVACQDNNHGQISILATFHSCISPCADAVNEQLFDLLFLRESCWPLK